MGLVTVQAGLKGALLSMPLRYQRALAKLFGLKKALAKLFGLKKKRRAPDGRGPVKSKPALQKPVKSKPALSKPKANLTARSLNDKLWGGFSRSALRDLTEATRSRLVSPKEQSAAAWYLARWHAFQEDYERALDLVILSRALDGRRRDNVDLSLLEADCLVRLGYREQGRKILDCALEIQPDEPDLYLAYANTYASTPDSPSAATDDVTRLEWINRIYKKVNLLPLEKANSNLPLTLDNLATRRHKPSVMTGQPKISVIIPAYNAQNSLQFALRGLLGQTWQNLEIIVVDDCSVDDTLAVAENFAQHDPRIIVARQAQNQGAYSARNKGLKIASGDFITVHDADDWSHPQKFELQVTSLRDNPSLLANYTYWSRTLSNFRFTGNRPPRMIHPNMSSYLFRRDVFTRNGAWDRVRVGADAQYVRQLRQNAGSECINSALPAIPLSFSGNNISSLTRDKVTHVNTLKYGVRREYAESATYWRASSCGSVISIDPACRSFPAPGLILPNRESRIDCDLLFIMDFNIGGEAFVSTMNYVNAAVADGQSVAVFHWCHYDVDVTKPFNSEIRQMAQDSKLRIVSPGEKVHTSTVIVGCPTILQHAIDLCPEVECCKFVVIVSELAGLNNSSDPQYDPRIARENIAELFGTEGSWAPISEHVRRLMEADSRYPAPHFETWIPLIETTTWCAGPLRWRGRDRQMPVVGRHGRDCCTNWPSSPKMLNSAYCSDRICEVRILGGAAYAHKVIGKNPTNWIVHDSGAMDVRDFLSDLDFFLHYPHEGFIAKFSLSVIEAMAIGCPVVLSPAFECTFGACATYAEPEDVWRTIEELWSDQQAYLARAQAGRDFVLANCDWKQLKNRLCRLGRVTA